MRVILKLGGGWQFFWILLNFSLTIILIKIQKFGNPQLFWIPIFIFILFYLSDPCSISFLLLSLSLFQLYFIYLCLYLYCILFYFNFDFKNVFFFIWKSKKLKLADAPGNVPKRNQGAGLGLRVEILEILIFVKF